MKAEEEPLPTKTIPHRTQDTTKKRRAAIYSKQIRGRKVVTIEGAKLLAGQRVEKLPTLDLEWKPG